MTGLDVASIVFVCVTANHLGLIGKIEEIIGRLPIISCPKCFTFWSVLAYCIFNGEYFITTLAISFLASYAAIWLELIEGFIDLIYMRIYETIITTDYDDTPAADTEGGDTDGTVP